MPVRRRPARIPLHRRARPRRRPVGGGAARRRRHPRRPGHLLLSRRAGLASYFRSTIAHNTVELGGRNQSSEGGPFLWVASRGGPGSGSHRRAGQSRSGPPNTTATPVSIRLCGIAARSGLTGRRACIDIVDEFEGGSHDLRLAFHCGPEVEAELDEARADLRWPSAPVPGAARFELPRQLRWSLYRGETDPIMGWYAYGLGRRTPAFTLIGRGRSAPGDPLRTRLAFLAEG